jgi:V8-like Glu-specific endopeptidase
MRRFLIISLLAALTLSAKTKDNRTVFVESGGSSCTGYIVETNRVLTCGHCVHGTVMVNEKPARVVKLAPDKDLALLELETSTYDRIRLASVEPADEVYTWGHPMGDKDLLYSRGYVMKVSSREIFSSTIALGGDSGSPLFDMKGNLVGMTCTKVGDNNQDFPIAMSITAKTIREFLQW